MISAHWNCLVASILYNSSNYDTTITTTTHLLSLIVAMRNCIEKSKFLRREFAWITLWLISYIVFLQISLIHIWFIFPILSFLDPYDVRSWEVRKRYQFFYFLILIFFSFCFSLKRWYFLGLVKRFYVSTYILRTRGSVAKVKQVVTTTTTLHTGIYLDNHVSYIGYFEKECYRKRPIK